MQWAWRRRREQPAGTDSIRGELSTLRVALDAVPIGIVVLDAELRAQLINRAFRKMWRLPDGKADGKPAFVALMYHGRDTRAYDVPAGRLDAYVAERVAYVKSGNPTPIDVQLASGDVIRFQCSVLPGGGRMLTYTDKTDIARGTAQIEQLATTDAMTGVYNRCHFLALADAEWDRFQRYHRPLSLMLFDIDHFKSINDHFGHEIGDRVMWQIVDLCRASKRNPDIIGRMGSDEFAVLLPESDLAQAKIVADRLRQEFAANPPFAEGVRIAVTVSIGVAEATLSMSNAGALMKLAEQSLYQAKAGGRNRTVVGAAKPILGYDLAAE
jgi:diguanylate cyclase (GGDEF)-like protein